MTAEIIDQRTTFFRRHVVEAPDLFADVERLAPGFRMHAHHRLGHRRIETLLFNGACYTCIVVCDFARAGQMYAMQTLEQLFHAVG